ncbi:RING-H2 finger protein ATL47-like [Lotus japonicus]|uniref:RING-H2 finger protein ATL47-like n=1 Tax=Lotus japonicus TaxID=34305 RepID=UPI0025865920|nr:RING-H2 finger protein ATL47-like [Lotus japonicus]
MFLDQTGQVNPSSTNHRQIRPNPPIEALQSLGSSSDGSGERYPERVSRPTVQVHPNVIPNDGLNVIVSPHESSVATEIQDGTNVEQNGQLQLAEGNAQQLPSIMSLSLFNPEMRDILGTREEYVDSEELGVLDCMHRYHIDCIKTWLVLNNSCPICKRNGITLNDEENKDD